MDTLWGHGIQDSYHTRSKLGKARAGNINTLFAYELTFFWPVGSCIEGETSQQTQKWHSVKWLIGSVCDDSVKESRSALCRLLSWRRRRGWYSENNVYSRSTIIWLESINRYLCSTTNALSWCIHQTSRQGYLPRSRELHKHANFLNPDTYIARVGADHNASVGQIFVFSDGCCGSWVAHSSLKP